MSTYKDVKEIKKIYDCGGYFSHMPIPKKVPADYIFDENISVKRNRDMVQKHNENVQKLKEEKRGQNNILVKNMSTDVVNYLVGEYGFKKTQAEKLENFIYNDILHGFPIRSIVNMVNEVNSPVKPVVSISFPTNGITRGKRLETVLTDGFYPLLPVI